MNESLGILKNLEKQSEINYNLIKESSNLEDK